MLWLYMWSFRVPDASTGSSFTCLSAFQNPTMVLFSSLTSVRIIFIFVWMWEQIYSFTCEFQSFQNYVWKSAIVAQTQRSTWCSSLANNRLCKLYASRIHSARYMRTLFPYTVREELMHVSCREMSTFRWRSRRNCTSMLINDMENVYMNLGCHFFHQEFVTFPSTDSFWCIILHLSLVCNIAIQYRTAKLCGLRW